MKKITDKNSVELLLDEEFFEQLHEQICRIEVSEVNDKTYILFGMWLIKPDTILPPVVYFDNDSIKTQATRSFESAIQSLNARGHKVKFVLWVGANPGAEIIRWPIEQTLYWSTKILTLGWWKKDLGFGTLRFSGGSKVFGEKIKCWAENLANVEVFLEPYNIRVSITGGYGFSQHQKICVFSHAGQIESICGGFNINSTYSAKLDHGKDDQGWHDTAVLIKGAAAYTIQQEWLRRWNKQYYNFSYSLPVTEKEQATDGKSRVTIATTNAGDYFSGEYDIKNMMIERIRNAKNYIYLENYALTDPDLVGELSERLTNHSTIKLIVLITHTKNPYYGTDKIWSSLEWFTFVRLSLPRFKSVTIRQEGYISTSTIQLSHPEDNFHSVDHKKFYWKSKGATKHCLIKDIVDIQSDAVMYGPISSGFPASKNVPKSSEKLIWPYVHSKLALFDDEYAFIGSSNWTQRSMGYDGEITAMINDNVEVLKIRNRLFSHWQGTLNVDNWKTTAEENESCSNLQPNTCYILPLRFSDFLHPKKVDYMTWGKTMAPSLY